jgi:hypothetical protein
MVSRQPVHSNFQEKNLQQTNFPESNFQQSWQTFSKTLIKLSEKLPDVPLYPDLSIQHIYWNLVASSSGQRFKYFNTVVHSHAALK